MHTITFEVFRAAKALKLWNITSFDCVFEWQAFNNISPKTTDENYMV